ncbi:ABC transporter ATP-binding protein [Streptomyces sp. NPDC005438]|uniref:ABC transporter ATP-binding protein n=1 Tax=Streptomyces sp. NPDC005438 TaxID=3156880 RepID=UPI0033B5ABB6
MTSPPRLLATATARAGGWFALATVAAVSAAAATLALPTALADALDAVVQDRSTRPPVTWLALVVVVLAVSGAVRAWAAGAYDAVTVAWLRRGLATRALAAGVPGQRRFPAGDLGSRMVGSCAQAGQAGFAIVSMALSLLTSLGALVALWLVDWRLGTAFVLGVPPAVLVIRVFMNRGTKVFGEYQETQARISALLLEATTGSRTIGAAGTVRDEIGRVLKPLPDLARTGHRTWMLQRDTAWQLNLLLPEVQVLVLAVGGYALVQGDLTAGELTAVVGYTSLALGLIDQVESLFVLSMAAAGARRVAEVIDQPVPTPGHLDRTPSPQAASVTLRQVTVQGDDGPVLHDIDLHLPAGDTLALVGRSGAGKSTLAALFGRLRDPDRGQVLIAGHPVEDLSPRALRRTVGYAFEKPALLGETLRDTLLLADPDAPDARLTAAARAARVDGFVRGLPEGYHTPLSEVRLSGGEIQRLGLARALVQDAAVVVLDDATSSLDMATEAEVDAAMTAAWAGRTRVVVAHRASTAARADLVGWLEDGRLRGLAPHRRLWENPDYRALFEVTDRTEPEAPCPTP